MVFVYYGQNKKIAEEVLASAKSIDRVYREVLGDENYTRLEEIVGTSLSPPSFLDDPAILSKILPGYNIKFIQVTDKGTSEHYKVFNLDTMLNEQGKIISFPNKVSNLFYVSEESFARSNSATFSNRIITSYIHEFNHFVIDSLQKGCLSLITPVSGAYTGQYFNHPQKVLDFATEIVKVTDLDDEKKANLIHLAALTFQYDFEIERVTRILDRQVLKGIGIKRDLNFRNISSTCFDVAFKDPSNIKIRLPRDGDPFEGLGDKQAVRSMINWEEHFSPLISYPFVSQFIDSLKQTHVEIISLQGFIEEGRDKKA